MRQFSQLPLPPQGDPDLQRLSDSVVEVQQQISSALSTAQDIDVLTTPPLNPVTGMVRYADGVGWDPGAGAGLYYYDGTTWQWLAPMSFIAANFVYAGYGGIRQGTPGVAGADIGAVYQTITSFDVGAVATPLHVTQNVAGDGLGFLLPGVWQVTVGLAFAHNSDNAGRTTFVRIYNSTTAQGGAGATVATGRNAEATNFSVSMLVDVSADDLGDLFQIQIGGGDVYTAVEWDVASFSVNHVSPGAGSGSLLPPGAGDAVVPVKQTVFGDMTTFTESSDNQPNVNWAPVTGGTITVPASWPAGAVRVMATIHVACITINPGTVNPPAGTCPEFAMDLGFSVNAGAVADGLVFRGVTGIQLASITTDEEAGIGGRVSLDGILNVSPGDTIRLQGQKSPGVWEIGVAGDNGWLAYVNVTGLFGKLSVITIQPVDSLP